MSTGESTWEARLLAFASENDPVETRAGAILADATQLERAYARSDAVASENSRTFYLASALLPPPERRAMRALYAFCRVTDDLIDRAQGDPAAGLEAWEARTLGNAPACDDPVALAWTDTRMKYGIPMRYARQLVAGVAADLTTRRYANFAALAEYCYGVAATVGLMSMHIVGFTDHRALPYAIKLGVAMQLTNILRDVREDWQNGRVYLPQDELAAFGLTDADIATGRCTPRWQAFMQFQIERNRRLYDEAMPGIAALQPRGRFAIAAAAELYRGILNVIAAHGGDVFSRRAHLSAVAKVRRLPGIWWRWRATGFTPEPVGDAEHGCLSAAGVPAQPVAASANCVTLSARGT